jgi:hypothetical protein
MKHFIYILSNPATGEIFYVGCTGSPKHRYYQHRYHHIKKIFNTAKLTEKDFYIMSMQCDPVFHVIEEVCGFKEVGFIRESFWITFLLSKGFPLVNKNSTDLEIVLSSELYGLPKTFNPIGILEFDNTVDSEILDINESAERA